MAAGGVVAFLGPLSNSVRYMLGASPHTVRVSSVALTQSEIVRTAVRMVDEVGLDRMSLRALATRLGISAPTLYWHVRDKRHLLDLVAEQVMADLVPSQRRVPRPGEPLEAWLTEWAHQQRAAMLAHRDSARVVAGNRPTEGALDGIEQTLGVLVDAGLEPGEAVRVLTAIGSFVIGDTLETQASAERSPDGDKARSASWMDRYPLLARAAQSLGADDDRFAEGLALLMDGLRARIEQRQPACRGSGKGAQ